MPRALVRTSSGVQGELSLSGIRSRNLDGVTANCASVPEPGLGDNTIFLVDDSVSYLLGCQVPVTVSVRPRLRIIVEKLRPC